MKFEHQLAVNPGPDTDEPGPDKGVVLDRDAVWAGLLMRVEDPVRFLPGLVCCEIVARSPGALRRRLVFGSVVVEDVVSIVPHHSVSFRSLANAEHAGGELVITLIDDVAAGPCLRFSYRTTLDETANADGVMLGDYVRAAYAQSDADTVRIIRALACER